MVDRSGRIALSHTRNKNQWVEVTCEFKPHKINVFLFISSESNLTLTIFGPLILGIECHVERFGFYKWASFMDWGMGGSVLIQTQNFLGLLELKTMLVWLNFLVLRSFWIIIIIFLLVSGQFSKYFLDWRSFPTIAPDFNSFPEIKIEIFKIFLELLVIIFLETWIHIFRVMRILGLVKDPNLPAILSSHASVPPFSSANLQKLWICRSDEEGLDTEIHSVGICGSTMLQNPQVTKCSLWKIFLSLLGLSQTSLFPSRKLQ